MYAHFHSIGCSAYSLSSGSRTKWSNVGGSNAKMNTITKVEVSPLGQCAPWLSKWTWTLIYWTLEEVWWMVAKLSLQARIQGCVLTKLVSSIRVCTERKSKCCSFPNVHMESARAWNIVIFKKSRFLTKLCTSYLKPGSVMLGEQISSKCRHFGQRGSCWRGRIGNPEWPNPGLPCPLSYGCALGQPRSFQQNRLLLLLPRHSQLSILMLALVHHPGSHNQPTRIT